MSTNIKDKNGLEKTSKDSFPLHDAILDEKIEIASEFCKSIKAENIHIIDGFNENGDTPLICAIIKENEDIVDILLQSGANPNQKNINGETPLTISTKHFNPNILTMLIEEGADINQTNSLDESPLKIATNLSNSECINLLTEYGASFAKKSASTSPTKSTLADFNYLEALEALVKEVVESKKAQTLQKHFEESCLAFTNQYLDKKVITKTHASAVQKVFDQICSAAKENITEKDSINFVRKLISAISANIKHVLLSQDDTHSLYLLSKAETSAEEQMTKLKIHSESQQPSPVVELVTPSKEIVSEYSSEDLYKKTHESKEMFETTKEKMLCRTSKHEMVLAEIITLRPHYPRVYKDAESLLKLSKKRLAEESELLGTSKAEIKKSISEVEKIISSAKTQNRHFTNNEGHQIDELLRPGKTDRIHIIHFPSDSFGDPQKEILIEALETGATIHYFEYPECAETTNDLIFAGIAAVNKLLDENIHPDRIILQGAGEETSVVRDTTLQFEKRGIHLTKFFIGDDKISQDSDHRTISLTNQTKPTKDCDPEMKKFLVAFNKLLKAQSRLQDSFFFKNKNQLTVSQLINLYIKKTQQFYHTHPKFKNTSLPKERVESIIGLTDIDES